MHSNTVLMHSITISKKTFFALFAITVMCVCAFDVSAQNKLAKYDVVVTRQDGSTVTVKCEIAKTESEKSQGFMFRKTIPDGTGMIFVYTRDTILSFWMKNTPTALSIAYVDSRGTIREIYDMAPFSQASVVSTVSVRYALEVPQGYFLRQKISPGDMISLDFLHR
ncbi:MAG: DUF192 domain-containing protein [Treponemataceae bacterium]|nr:MAG: DUF192 domain-containing protein [Treponemataceae bacterium]